MKRRCIVVSFLSILLFVIGLAIGDHAMAQKKPIILRLVEPAPADDYPLSFKDFEFAKRFNERAKGEYKIEVNAGGALAKLPEYFDAVRVGAVEMADGPWGLYAFADPRLSLIEMPFLFVSDGAANAACKPLVKLYDQLLQEKFNAKGLALANTGGLQVWSSKPIKTLEDWKGTLVGVISPPSSKLVKDLGGAPVTVMWTEMFEALQKKVIDGAVQGTHGMVATQLYDVVKNGTIFFGIVGWNGYTINLDVWKKMPQHIKDILQEEADRAMDWMSEITTTKLPADDMKVFKEKGVSVYILPKAEREKWESIVAASNKAEFEKFGDFGQKVKSLADDLNKRFPYSEKSLF
jgi:TRAP-type C4-dicarboxylate transport system substrate-binding protein